jgi:ribosomal protein L16 Arg81 hydroxylase
MIDKNLIARLISENTFQHITEAITPDFINWEDVTDYFVPFTTRHVEVIGRNEKVDIPKKGLYQDRDFILKHISENHSFCISKFINVNPSVFRLFEFFCATYEKQTVDFHLYGGLSESSTFFPPHNDLATNYIIQLDGECHWTIYNEQATYDEALHYKKLPEEQLSIEYETILKPGDVLYIPSGKYHKCVPLGKRLSLSVPIL